MKLIILTQMITDSNFLEYLDPKRTTCTLYIAQCTVDREFIDCQINLCAIVKLTKCVIFFKIEFA